MKRQALSSLLAAALCAALCGCEREPDEILFLSGRVVDASGAPRPGVPVALWRNGAQACGDVESAFRPLPHGWSPGEAALAEERESDAFGRYRFRLTLRDARSDEGEFGTGWIPACFELRARTKASSSTLSLRHNGEDLEVPDLPLRDTAPAIKQGFAGLYGDAPEVVSLAGYSHTTSGWDFTREEETVWLAPDRDASAPLDGPLWEDFGPLEARHRMLAVHLGELPFLSTAQPLVALLAIEGPPVEVWPPRRLPYSRGAECFVSRGAGPEVPCALTDGKLAVDAWMDEAAWPEGPPDEILLVLSWPRVVQRLVVRDLAFTRPAEALFVEGSADRMTWSRIGELGSFPHLNNDAHRAADYLRTRRSYGLFAEVPLAPEPGTQVKFLRLRGVPGRVRGPDGEELPPEPFRFLGARELSVF